MGVGVEWREEIGRCGRELGENHTPHVGTEVDTLGSATGEVHFLVALIFFENLS